jgi:N-formylglutamate amidohydrolase
MKAVVMLKILCLMLIVSACKRLPENSKPFTREVYYGQQQFVEYRTGNLPVILSVPHGGYLKPIEIPDRNCTGCSYVMDANTQELARTIDSILTIQTGCSPHLIINRLHRIRLDANRDVGDAADGNPTAFNSWASYHQYIEDAKKAVIEKYGRGILIDLHGHGHSIQRLELGYLLDDADLQKIDTDLNTPDYVNRVSIKSLQVRNQATTSLSQLLRGPYSFGTLVAQKGYPAVPSQQIATPLAGELYFSGGYTTERHGSRNNGAIDAIQIECNMQGVRDTGANRLKFANALGQTLQEFLKKYYFDKEITEICK